MKKQGASRSLFSCPYQRAFADPCHGGDLTVGLALFQEGQRKFNLLRRELLLSI